MPPEPSIVQESAPRVLLLFTRLPERGRVKTRLIPALGAEGACRLHRALLHDTLRLAGQVWRACSCDVVVAWTGRGSPRRLARAAPMPVRLLHQEGDGLGERLAHAHRLLFASGAAAVVTLGCDSPSLPAAMVEEAFLRLERVEVVLGPAADGGYVLLGTSRFLPALFRDIPWGTSDACRVTRRRTEQEGAEIHLLPEWYDVDDPQGLQRLREDLERCPELPCSDTRLFLETSREPPVR